jgi:hypothetical protein
MIDILDKIKIDALIHLLNLKYDLEGNVIKKAKRSKWKKELSRFINKGYREEEIRELLKH